MDESMEREQILRALEELGMDMRAERFNTEIHHLLTFFAQGQTVMDALRTVSDPRLRSQLKPVLYTVALRACVLALARLEAITPAQARDLTTFLDERAGMQKRAPRQRRMGDDQ